ncbi:MAG: Lrp/AsnC family transcriptional regulator [Candidatus Thorarchaeota archaeon]|nr:Lrp/AsnC family transcriptional regulator [Candidatus Thorarchaeota archaeon]
MDNVDKRLISILQEDGRKSLSEIGEELDMTHVAVSKRLHKLVKEKKLVHITAGVNAEELDIKLLFMGIETENMDVAEHIKKKYKNCPRLLMLAPVTGRYNLFAVLAAEDTWSLESIIGTCSMRTEPGVRRSESWFGNAPAMPQYLGISLAPGDGTLTKTPCGRNCGTCGRYKEKKCVGCPPTSHYRGKLWASPLTERRRRKSKS